MIINLIIKKRTFISALNPIFAMKPHFQYSSFKRHRPLVREHNPR